MLMFRILVFLKAVNKTIAFLMPSSLVDGSKVTRNVSRAKESVLVSEPHFPNPVHPFVLKMETAYFPKPWYLYNNTQKSHNGVTHSVSVLGCSIWCDKSFSAKLSLP
jgi:hypothetical protein